MYISKEIKNLDRDYKGTSSRTTTKSWSIIVFYLMMLLPLLGSALSTAADSCCLKPWKY